MVWLILGHPVAFLVDLIAGGRRAADGNDLEIVLLRHQLRILQRKTPRHIIGDAGVYLSWRHTWPVRAAGWAPESRFARARGVHFLPR